MVSQTMREVTTADFRVGLPAAHISDKELQSVLYFLRERLQSLIFSYETSRHSFDLRILCLRDLS